MNGGAYHLSVEGYHALRALLAAGLVGFGAAIILLAVLGVIENRTRRRP